MIPPGVNGTRPNGLCGILDHDDVVVTGDLNDTIDLGALPKQVNRNHRFGSRRDGGLNTIGINVERVGADVDEDRRGAQNG